MKRPFKITLFVIAAILSGCGVADNQQREQQPGNAVVAPIVELSAGIAVNPPNPFDYHPDINLSVFDGRIFVDPEITINGSLGRHTQIKAILNGEDVDVTDTYNHNFHFATEFATPGFEISATLQEGSNTLCVTGIDHRGEVFSRNIKLFYYPNKTVPTFEVSGVLADRSRVAFKNGRYSISTEDETQTEIVVQINWELDSVRQIRIFEIRNYGAAEDVEPLAITDEGITFIADTPNFTTHLIHLHIFDVFGQERSVIMDITTGVAPIIVSIWTQSTSEILIPPPTSESEWWQADYNIDFRLTEPTEFMVRVHPVDDSIRVAVADSAEHWSGGSLEEGAHGLIPVTRDGDVFRFKIEPSPNAFTADNWPEGVRATTPRQIHVFAYNENTGSTGFRSRRFQVTITTNERLASGA